MSRLSLAALHDRMVERDWQVVADIAKYRLLTSRQIQRLHFDAAHSSPLAAARACSRALSRLREAGVLRALDRRIGGVRAGSASYIWFLGPAGERLLHHMASAADATTGVAGLGQTAARRSNYREPSRHFVDHTLAISELAVQITAAARTGPFEVLRLETEPSNWQTMLGPHGVASFLKPDLLLVTATHTAAGEYEDHYFIELDLATESASVVMRQCAAYQAFRATGRYQSRHGLFPTVWWLTPTQARANTLRGAVARTNGLTSHVGTSNGIADSTGGTGGALFRFCIAEEFPRILETSD